MDATSMASFWALVALVIFLGIVIYMKVPAMVGKALDQRADKIREDLAAAKSLREEAQALLAEYQKKRKEAEAEAGEIVAAAKREADILSAEAKQKTEEFVARRTALSEQKIKRAETEAVDAVRAAAVDVAMAAAEKLIVANVDDKAQAALFAKAIGDVKGRLN